MKFDRGEHTLEISNVWKLLINGLHLEVKSLFLCISKVLIEIVHHDKLVDFRINLLELWFILSVGECLIDHLELLHEFFDCEDLAVFLVFLHDQFNYIGDESPHEKEAYGTEEDIKNESKDCKEGPHVPEVVPLSEYYGYSYSLTEIKGKWKFSLLFCQGIIRRQIFYRKSCSKIQSEDARLLSLSCRLPLGKKQVNLL